MLIMGSLGSQLPLKRENLLRFSSAGKAEKHLFFQRPRSKFWRFALFSKIDYLQWIYAVAVFLVLVVIFQINLPRYAVDESHDMGSEADVGFQDLIYLKELRDLDFGGDVRFESLRMVEKLNTENLDAEDRLNLTQRRFGRRKPLLALVFGDLFPDPQQLLMVTMATALQESGYSFQVFTVVDGPVADIWKGIGVPVSTFQFNEKMELLIDWLNFDGVLVNSLSTKNALSCFLQEPFKSVPLIWTIDEQSLAIRTKEYTLLGMTELVNDWKRIFSRATAVVFPNHALPVIYSSYDAGNYYVVPGTPTEPWEADAIMALNKDDVRTEMGYVPDDFVVALVGSQFSYSGLWLEHALVLQAVSPLISHFPPSDNDSACHLKTIVLSGYSDANYSMAVEVMSSKLSYPSGSVKHMRAEGNTTSILFAADLVIYASFLEEKSFPEILMKAMSVGKPIVAPDLPMITEYVNDRVNGYLFPKENARILTDTVEQLIINGKLSDLAQSVAARGKDTARNMMAEGAIKGYALLLENVLQLPVDPSEVSATVAVERKSPNSTQEWHWHLFQPLMNSSSYGNRILKSYKFLDEVEEQWNLSRRGKGPGLVAASDDSFSNDIWEEEVNDEIHNRRKQREDEEMKDRSDQSSGTWEEAYRSAKKADRTRNDLYERDDIELERAGQLLCIYEPYFGEGTWPFLHHSSLYRGIALSMMGRRPGVDDIDGPSRLQLLNVPYYRDILGEYGAFFAIANRSDDGVHKSSWIGFQSWRATAMGRSLSSTSERALVDAMEAQIHGDAVYFWVRLDDDARNRRNQTFWSFCDSIDAGNCRLAFAHALNGMYGTKVDVDSLPAMPDSDGDSWSVNLCWALPTRSFLEFVMFSRMFVDALDAEMHDHCYLAQSLEKHCYAGVLELLINVWAYHSGRHMVYVNPKSGLVREEHRLESRRGMMWVKWFSYGTLKAMDEDLAEAADSDRHGHHWLWPLTGEVVWRGVVEKERSRQYLCKERKRQKSRDKLSRMRRKRHQKTLGKYLKPPPDN